jgi:hypothetical protein
MDAGNVNQILFNILYLTIFVQLDFFMPQKVKKEHNTDQTKVFRMILEGSVKSVAIEEFRAAS